MYAIRTRYHGPTYTKGSRIIATYLADTDEGKRPPTVTISYPYEFSGMEVHRQALVPMLAKLAKLHGESESHPFYRAANWISSYGDGRNVYHVLNWEKALASE